MLDVISWGGGGGGEGWGEADPPFIKIGNRPSGHSAMF